MEIKAIHDQKIWDNFVTQHQHTFLHSWAWGEVNKKAEDHILRVGAYENNALVCVALIVVVVARRGTFLFIPHGPIFKNESYLQPALKALSLFLVSVYKQYNASFARISPLLEETEHNDSVFSKLGYRSAPIYMHAENSWVLPLDKTKDELLAGMRKTTRNLIRRGERDGVEIIDDHSDSNLKQFCKLYDETVQKHGFTPFSYSFLRTEIDAFNNSDDPNISARLYLASWQENILSGAIIIHYGNSAFYHHGANSLLHTKVPSSYALQWRAICDAIDAGKKFYNFWGITKSENKQHPWAGLTLFKKGFGGMHRDYIHAYDLPFNRKYWIPYCIDSFRMWRRRV